MDMYSQINIEINSQVYKLCESIGKHFNVKEIKKIYKLWVDSLPKEVTENLTEELNTDK